MAGIRQFQKYCRERAGMYPQAKDALLMIDLFYMETRPKNRKPRPSTSVKMTPEIRAKIRELNATTDLSQHAIATRMNVNQGRVNETVKRK